MTPYFTIYHYNWKALAYLSACAIFFTGDYYTITVLQALYHWDL